VVEFIEANTDRLRELSLRMALTIGAIRTTVAAMMAAIGIALCLGVLG
jgi:hypothetical protein